MHVVARGTLLNGGMPSHCSISKRAKCAFGVVFSLTIWLKSLKSAPLRTKHSPLADIPLVPCFKGCKCHFDLKEKLRESVQRPRFTSRERLHKNLQQYAFKNKKKSAAFEIRFAKSQPVLSVMYPGASATSLWLLIFMVTLAHCSVEFFIDQTFDQCSRGNNVIACANNTDRGGLCAYAPDANELWCCPAPDPCVQMSPLPVETRDMFT